MSIEALKEELRQLSREDQRKLMGFLADLRREHDSGQQLQVPDHELDDPDSTSWVKWGTLKREIREMEKSGQE